MSATDPMPAYPLAVRQSVRYPLINHTSEDISIDMRKLNGAADELKNTHRKRHDSISQGNLQAILSCSHRR